MIIKIRGSNAYEDEGGRGTLAVYLTIDDDVPGEIAIETSFEEHPKVEDRVMGVFNFNEVLAALMAADIRRQKDRDDRK